MNFKRIFFATAALGTGLSIYKYKLKINNSNDLNKPKYITRKEVTEHYTKETRIWTSYKDSVYDITDFVKVHPGGEDKIMLVAGGALEPFWEMYSFHKKADIVSSLEKYKIGKLDPKDIMDPKDIPDFNILKKEELWRSPFLKVHQSFPYCAEADETKLLDHFYTPVEHFFVRNHYSVPVFSHEDLRDYSIEVSEGENKFLVFYNSLEDLFGVKKVDTIMTCTGNRRAHFNKVKVSKGLPWQCGAMSNANWEGIPVSTMLNQMGYTKENAAGKHLIVTGGDKDFQGSHYQISIPLEHAVDPTNLVLLATKYNGGEIPKEHGFPVRFVVPGFAGVRNVKWVKKIEIADHEATSSFQKKDYKQIIGVEWDNIDKVDLTKYNPIMEVVPSSVIIFPRDGEKIEEKSSFVEFKGYAHGRAGIHVKDILISFDNGQTWTNVDKVNYENNSSDKTKYFGWVFWSHKLNLNNVKDKDIKAVVKVIDMEGNTQVEDPHAIWNARGLLNNSYHRIHLEKH